MTQSTTNHGNDMMLVGVTSPANITFKSTRELRTIQKSSIQSIVTATNEMIREQIRMNSSSNNKTKKRDHDDMNDDDDDEDDIVKLSTSKSSLIKHTSGLASDPSEARYWLDSFGLRSGNHVLLYSNTKRKHNKFSHVRCVDIVDATSSSIIHQLIFHSNLEDNNTTDTTSTSSNRTFLAIMGGPRIQLYGTTNDSTFHRVLSSNQPSYNNNNKGSSKIITSCDRQIPTGGQLVISSSIRSDSRLIAIGTDRGIIRIADCTNRITLSQYHTTTMMPIRSVLWFRNGQHIISSGDDAIVRIWQLKQTFISNSNNNNNNARSNNDSAMIEWNGHGDSIRCAVLWQLSDKQKQKLLLSQSLPYYSLLATGSYDHTIRLWNVDHIDTDKDDNNKNESNTNNSNDQCVSILQHGAPVEALQWITSLSYTISPVWLVSAGGIIIKVWNPMNGTCVATIQTQHRKTITSLLCMPRIYINPNNQNNREYSMRLLSGGLDGFIRIYSFDRENGTIQHLHGIRIMIPSSSSAQKKEQEDPSKEDGSVIMGITALAVTPNSDRLAIALTNGTVLVRQKGPNIINKKKLLEPRAGTYSFFTRGMNTKPNYDDQIITDINKGTINNPNKKLAKYDIAFKQFRYIDALDIAFDNRNPIDIMNVFEELGKRRGLHIALSNRDEIHLEPILSFIIKYISHPKYTEILIGITDIILQLYRPFNNNNNSHNNSTTITAVAPITSSNSTGNNSSDGIRRRSMSDNDMIDTTDAVVDNNNPISLHSSFTKSNNSSNVSTTTSTVGRSDVIDELLNKLRLEIRNECRIQKSIFNILGKMDAVIMMKEADEMI